MALAQLLKCQSASVIDELFQSQATLSVELPTGRANHIVLDRGWLLSEPICVGQVLWHLAIDACPAAFC